MASLLEQALPLVDYISTAVGKTHDFGHLTSQIYDTAWVSMIRLHNKQSNDLLFPECYTYILSRQLPSGGWESYDTDIDGIMNTFAALLALKKNWDSKYSPADIKVRIDRAVSYLRDMLNAWDEASIAECDHVGFEIIIPHMMELLEQEGVLFDFPGKDILMTLNSKKLAKIHPKIWSGKIQTTITHSLEAFGGKADFRGLSEQTVHGGMGSSPASTAAWLMYTEGWDVESEECLRNLIRQREPEVGSEGKGVPGMYATTGFEVLWVSQSRAMLCTISSNC